LKHKASTQQWVFLGVVVCLLASLVTFGCAGTTTSPTTPTSTGPKTGGVLKIAQYGDNTALGYPPRLSTVYEGITKGTCLESLGRFDEKDNIVPVLATEFKPDPKTSSLTVVLRKGVKFHDLTDFNAQACKWNLDNYVAAKKGELDIKSMDIIDDYTLRINLTAWDADAVMKLCYYCGPMISPTAYQKAGTTDKERLDWALNNPVGTGPFQFVSWTREVKIVYKKFANYWQPGKPYLDGVEWITIIDPVTAAATLKSGEINVLYGVIVSSVKDLVASGMIAKSIPGSMLQCFIPDSAHADSPFSNLKVRQAMQHAIDSKAILDSLYLGYGGLTNQWSSASLYSYNPNVKGYPYDPAKARQLIKESGYPEVKISLICQNVGEGLQISTAVQGYLKAVGIDAQIDAMTNAKVASVQQTEGWSNASIFRTPRAWDVITQMSRYLSSTKGTYLAHKKSVMKIDKLDLLIDEAVGATDAKTQQAKAWEIQKIIIDDYALVTVICDKNSIVVESPKVQNSGLSVHVTQWTPEDAWLK
jgi:peptide/nickel transport system substrate-binding protein